MPHTRVGIIGLGQGGKALAAHLSSRGFVPLIYCPPGHRNEYNAIRANNSHIEATQAVNGSFPVLLVDDLAEFVRRTDTIILVTLSTAHRSLLALLAAHDLRHTTLIALPGGASFAAKARQHNLHLNARNILESCTLPYAARSPARGHVAVLYIKRTFPLAALHPLPEQHASALQALFDHRVDWHPSLLSIWLNCTNPVVHCPPMLLNAGRIECEATDFALYGEGITPSVARATMALDAEREALAERLGVPFTSVLAWTNRWYDAAYPDWVTFARTSSPHNKQGLAPTQLRGSRFLEEDMKETMVWWCELGRRVCGLEMPVMRSMIALTSVLVEEEYAVTGVTLEALGMEGWGREELIGAFGPQQQQKKKSTNDAAVVSAAAPPPRSSSARNTASSPSTTCLRGVLGPQTRVAQPLGT